MAARNKPYEQFGPYLLFKKLEQDSVGDLWRAARILDGQLGPTVALRRLSGGNRAALSASFESAAHILPQLSGTSFVRDQIAGTVEGVPFLAWDYAGGRSLRHIVDRSRGGKDFAANPLPLDQAIVIAEKVALSLATIAELRDGSGQRLSHGALLPQFIWISDDGEIRVGGQQIGPGLVLSLAAPAVAAEIGRYFAPEMRTAGQTPKNADVFAMGAILFLLVTGQEPPDAMTASAFGAAVRAAKTTTGAAIPDDIRIILDKSFNLDPSMRYASIADMKQALSALAHGGKYSASTFNLAFYLSNLLKKEMESDAAEREKEAKVALAPYLETPRSSPAPSAPAPAHAATAASSVAAPAFGASMQIEQKPKSRLPLVIAGVVVIAGAGVGGWMMLGSKSGSAPAAKPVTAQVLPKPAAPAPQQPIPEPIVVSGGTATTTAPVTATANPSDPAAQKKAFEDAVRAKLQAEMLKLQSDYMEELKRQQSKNAPVSAPAPAPVAAAAAPQQVEDRSSISAAQLDQQRREANRQDDTPAPAPAPVQQPQTAAVAQQQAPAPVPVQAPSIREGDVVEYANLDSLPRATRPITAIYPPIARQQRISATVVVSALVNERGEVTDVKVLRGIGRFGIDEAAARAMRSARFTSPMKDGKRVKTWLLQPIEFRP